MMNAIALTASLLLATSPPAQPCKIGHSVYRDADGKGFELVFTDHPTSKTAKALATIDHPKQPQLYQFTVVQSSGYGSISMGVYPASRDPLDENAQLGLTFFDQALRSATPLFWGEEATPPHYAFISGLGRYDHYRRRGTTASQPPLIRDVLWVHDRCHNPEG